MKGRTTHPSRPQPRNYIRRQLQHHIRILPPTKHTAITITSIVERAELKYAGRHDPCCVGRSKDLAESTEEYREHSYESGCAIGYAEMPPGRVVREGGVVEAGVVGEEGGGEHKEADDCGEGGVEDEGGAPTSEARCGGVPLNMECDVSKRIGIMNEKDTYQSDDTGANSTPLKSETK